MNTLSNQKLTIWFLTIGFALAIGTLAFVWGSSFLPATVSGLFTPNSSGIGQDSQLIQPNSAGPSTITVSGIGEIGGKPDMASIQIGVDTVSADVKAAAVENQKIVANILDTLAEMNVADADVQTTNYSIWTEQRYEETGPSSVYHLTNQVFVKIRDIEQVDEVLSAAIDAGANNIYGISFQVSDQKALSSQARERAIANAYERANALAKLNDLTVGDVYKITEYNNFYGYQGGMGGGGGMVMDSAANIAAGEINFSSQVEVTYYLNRN